MAGKKLYGRSPKIDAAPAKGDSVGSDGGAPKVAAKEADKTASGGSVEGDMKSGGDAKADVMAGTDGISTHHAHIADRLELHHRQMLEHKDMMHRMERDHLARSLSHGGEDHTTMNARHNQERRGMHTRHEQESRSLGARHTTVAAADMKEKSVGTSGTAK